MTKNLQFGTQKNMNYVSMALCMGDNRVGDTSGQLAMPQEMGLARRHGNFGWEKMILSELSEVFSKRHREKKTNQKRKRDFYIGFQTAHSPHFLSKMIRESSKKK